MVRVTRIRRRRLAYYTREVNRLTEQLITAQVIHDVADSSGFHDTVALADKVIAHVLADIEKYDRAIDRIQADMKAEDARCASR